MARRLSEVPPALNPHRRLQNRRSKTSKSGKLYGAIVAQARLPVFYQGFGVPDTLEGRFVVLSLHLFAVLHRLKDGGSEAAAMAQALSDRFTADMETVLRELGVGDLAIPKKVRRLTASGAGLLQSFETALGAGDEALDAAIAAALPGDETAARAASARLTPYLKRLVRHLEEEPVQELCAGRLSHPDI
jgi:cytochrome b pre-mRNA-processing protein 3